MTAEGYWPGRRHRALLHAGLDPGDAAGEAWRSWRRMVDFDDVDETEHRLLPLAYLNLGDRLDEDPVGGRVRGVYRLAWARNQLLLSTAAEAVRVLRAERIPTLLLKGAPLGILDYRDMGARPMNDVDLLVHPAQARIAMRRLLAAGWQTQDAEPERMISVHHSYAVAKPPYGEVDLHWFSLFVSSGDTPLWEAAVPLEVAGEPTLAPCPADCLLNVCAHGSPRQPLPAFRWIADAVTIVRTGPLDWERLVAEARRRRLTVTAAAALGYLRDEFAVEVPAAVVEDLASAPAPRWERMAFRAATRERSPWGTLVLIAERHRRLRALGAEAPWHPGFLTYAASIWDFERPWQVVAYGTRRMLRFALSRLGLARRSPRPEPGVDRSVP